jgi:3-oxoacyl-[acyl-carrier protein] reductase
MKTALVTGGSRGIGRALVKEFAAAGYLVAFTYRENGEAAESLVREVAELSSRALALQADVRDFARAQEVVDEALEALGPLDVLLNNAGIRRDRALFHMDCATWQEVIDTNLNGTFNYCRAAIPNMVRRGGSIINVTSVSGQIGVAGQTNYSASKAGVIGLTKALAREVARFRVRVNAIAPGVISTDMTETMEPNARKKLVSQIPLGDTGTPEQVARMALYLAGEDAAFITGQVFTMDGGMS